jgi:hydrogenase expression/formation protein HypE
MNSMKERMPERAEEVSEYGKPKRGFMEHVVFRSLGTRNGRTVKGPGRGLDNAVVAIGRTDVMLITTDPMSVVPAIGMERSAWLSVHLIASDYTTSGQRPELAAFNFNFPKEMRTSDRGKYLRNVGKECRRLGISIVAGHTGSYPGAGYTVVGGGTMFGFCMKDEFVDASMARPGDAILMTKGAAIEAAAMLALSFPRHVERVAGRAACNRAKLMLTECSTVKDALTASTVGLGYGGVTSMHDATEGGILGGLAEMADASRRAFIIEKEKVHVPVESGAVCSVFNIDPLTTVSEGSLLLTCSPTRVWELQTRLRRRGIPSFELGRVRKGNGLWVSSAGRNARKVAQVQDRYWSAYERGVRARLD